MSEFILEATTILLNRMNRLESEMKMKMKNVKVNTPKVANTYGVAVNPQTGKMERIN
jgi:hypothetical protein|tara:strand:- start:4944 stop:5114 length:171 start_codon:yes stop_codon:yes gene_type:complete